MHENNKIAKISENALGAGVVSALIIESIKVFFPVNNIRIFYIGALGLIIAGASVVILKKRKVLRVFIPFIITAVFISFAFIVFKYYQDDAIVRLNQFEKEVLKIEESKMTEGEKCEKLVYALAKIQDEDKKSATQAQIDIFNRVKECHEKIKESEDHWKQVKKSYYAFNSSKTLASADEFITAMSQLTEFDKSRSIKEMDSCEREFKEVKVDIDKFNEIMKSLKKFIPCYLQDSQELNIKSKIEALLIDFENLSIHYKPGDLDPSQQHAIMTAYEIKNSKNFTVSSQKVEANAKPKVPIKPDQDKEVTGVSKHQDEHRTNVFIDTSAIVDRNLLLFKDVLNKKFESNGFNLYPFQDADILNVKILPPEDNRAITIFQKDSDGNYKYQVSLNVQLFLMSKGINKNIGNIKMPGLGSSELEALQKAQENLSTDIANKVINSMRKLNLL